MNKLVKRETGGLDTLESVGSFASIENSRCPDHYDLPIQYFCLNCKRHCFCSECALTNHQNCEVMTLDEAFKYILNNEINKWIAQLSTKSENLQVGFRLFLGDKRELWALKLQDLQNNSARTNQIVYNTLQEVNSSTRNWISEKNRQIQDQYQDYKKQVEQILVKYEDVAKSLREERKSPPAELLRFYNKNYQHLRQLLLSGILEHGKDLECVVKNTPKQLKSEIAAGNAKFKKVAGLLSNFQYNIRV
ncbi:hypothetical protein MACJ_001613 [Theileria orientalis]|uniref:B box-type domain-containing protein n=1 Tax=Theileria orientalis TaxID=68886 RepID=A0A976QSN8_THEOR|nr:hypothetical protein MACJ_001613 [Theileria orientalis]